MKTLRLTLIGAAILFIAIPASAQVLLATTNGGGNLVELDLSAGTATLIGDARSVVSW